MWEVKGRRVQWPRVIKLVLGGGETELFNRWSPIVRSIFWNFCWHVTCEVKLWMSVYVQKIYVLWHLHFSTWNVIIIWLLTISGDVLCSRWISLTSVINGLLCWFLMPFCEYFLDYQGWIWTYVEIMPKLHIQTLRCMLFAHV